MNVLPFEWDEFESVLFQQTIALLRSFAAIHNNEKFYAFCFDCDPVYGNVSPCLNTEEALRDHYENMKQGAYGYPPIEQSFSEFAEDARWNSGDWGYQHLQIHEPQQGALFSSAMSEFTNAFDDFTNSMNFDDRMPFYEKFMNSIRRVLYWMEADGAFSPIKTSSNFTVFVIDHDEAPEEAIHVWQNFRSDQEDAQS